MREPFHSISINAFPGRGELSVLFAGHSQTKADHQVGPQMLDYFLVHWVESGKGRFHCHGREYDLQRGDCFFIFPGELSEYASDSEEPWSYRWIGFDGTQADALLSRCGLSASRPIVTGTGKRTGSLFRQTEQALHEQSFRGSVKAEGLLRLIIAQFMIAGESADAGSAESPHDPSQQVQQAIRWLTLRYSRPISIDEMAQKLGYHRTHLSKLFKRHTGMPPQQYLLKIRMERAKLLLHKQLTIEQVAASVGFSDPLYFSKCFKKWYGLTPTDFRKRSQSIAYLGCSTP